MFQELQKVGTDDLSTGLPLDLAERRLDSLGLKDVLQAHREWKEQLLHSLDSEHIRRMSVFEICREDQCILGKWLTGPGHQRFGHLTAHGAARRAHAEFRQCAGELFRARRNLSPTEQVTELEYRLKDASSRAQLELVRLFTSPGR